MLNLNLDSDLPLQAYTVGCLICLFSHPDVLITLEVGEPNLIGPHDLLPLLHCPVYIC